MSLLRVNKKGQRKERFYCNESEGAVYKGTIQVELKKQSCMQILRDLYYNNDYITIVPLSGKFAYNEQEVDTWCEFLRKTFDLKFHKEGAKFTIYRKEEPSMIKAYFSFLLLRYMWKDSGDIPEETYRLMEEFKLDPMQAILVAHYNVENLDGTFNLINNALPCRLLTVEKIKNYFENDPVTDENKRIWYLNGLFQRIEASNFNIEILRNFFRMIATKLYSKNKIPELMNFIERSAEFHNIHSKTVSITNFGNIKDAKKYSEEEVKKELQVLVEFIYGWKVKKVAFNQYSQYEDTIKALKGMQEAIKGGKVYLRSRDYHRTYKVLDIHKGCYNDARSRVMPLKENGRDEMEQTICLGASLFFEIE